MSRSLLMAPMLSTLDKKILSELQPSRSALRDATAAAIVLANTDFVRSAVPDDSYLRTVAYKLAHETVNLLVARGVRDTKSVSVISQLTALLERHGHHEEAYIYMTQTLDRVMRRDMTIFAHSGRVEAGVPQTDEELIEKLDAILDGPFTHAGEVLTQVLAHWSGRKRRELDFRNMQHDFVASAAFGEEKSWAFCSDAKFNFLPATHYQAEDPLITAEIQKILSGERLGVVYPEDAPGDRKDTQWHALVHTPVDRFVEDCMNAISCTANLDISFLTPARGEASILEGRMQQFVMGDAIIQSSCFAANKPFKPDLDPKHYWTSKEKDEADTDQQIRLGRANFSIQFATALLNGVSLHDCMRRVSKGEISLITPHLVPVSAEGEKQHWETDYSTTAYSLPLAVCNFRKLDATCKFPSLDSAEHMTATKLHHIVGDYMDLLVVFPRNITSEISAGLVKKMGWRREVADKIYRPEAPVKKDKVNL